MTCQPRTLTEAIRYYSDAQTCINAVGPYALARRSPVCPRCNTAQAQRNHVALYPQKAYAWLIPKEEIWLKKTIRKDRPGIKPQHKGADAWVTVDPANPGWLKPYGGTIGEMIKVAKANL